MVNLHRGGFTGFFLLQKVFSKILPMLADYMADYMEPGPHCCSLVSTPGLPMLHYQGACLTPAKRLAALTSQISGRRLALQISQTVLTLKLHDTRGTWSS